MIGSGKTLAFSLFLGEEKADENIKNLLCRYIVQRRFLKMCDFARKSG